MTSEQFVYWFNGFLEIAQPEVITATQISIINDHLALVLKKETPTRELPKPLKVGTPTTWTNTGLKAAQAGDIVSGFTTGKDEWDAGLAIVSFPNPPGSC
jgi:hypothetical protein